MEVANIVPPPWAGVFPQGDYRMVLAHWASRYPSYAKDVRSKTAYLLLDNGAFEGEQVSTSELNRAIKATGADEAVLPDVLGEPKETLRRSWTVLGQLAASRVMFVPQGRTYDQWRRCLQAWLEKWSRSAWSETYKLSLGVNCLRQAKGTRPQVGTRTNLIAEAIGTGLPVHLLGVGDIREFTLNELPEARRLGVRGVDTSSAFALAAERKLLTPTAVKVYLGAPEKYETLPTWARRLVHLNIRILNEWVSAGAASTAILTHFIRQVASRWERYYAEGFVGLAEMMRACGMPPGRYALLKRKGREVYVRPLVRAQKPQGKETLIEIGGK